MQTSIKYLFFILIATTLSIYGCKHGNDVTPVEPPVDDPTPGGGNGGGGNGGGGNGGGGTGGGSNCDPNTVYFEQQILPILISSCAMPNLGCHDVATGSNKGVVLTSYNSLINSDDAWEQGKSPLDQDFWDVIVDGEMPQSPGTLSQEQKNLINTWLVQGAQNNSCVPNTCDTSNVTFSQTINPILQNKCVGCHNGSNASGGVNLSAHSGVQVVALNGKLYGAVSHAPGYTAMPFNSPKLPDCDIEKIRIWIDNGAQNN